MMTMKKTLLFIAVLLGLASTECAALVTRDISLENWGWSYQATTSYSDGVMTITVNGEYGQGATGWENPYLDWSKYSKMSVVIDSYNNDWGEIAVLTGTLKEGSTWEYIAAGKATFGTITSSTTIDVDLDATLASSVRSIYIKGKAPNDEIKVSRIYLTRAYDYETTGTALEYDQYGNVAASLFEGMPDETKVVFTYTLTMNDPYDIASYQGWGIGKIHGAGDNDILVTEIKSKSAGDVDVVLTKGDLNAALADKNTEYNYYAVNFSVWNLSGGENSVYGTTVRKSVKAYKPVFYKTIGVNGYSTFSADVAVSVPDGTEAYYATVNGEKTAVTLTKITDGIIPANTGVILKGTANADIVLTGVVTANTVVSDLSAVTDDLTLTDGDYVLYNNGTSVEFRKATGTIAANKAYIPATAVADAPSLSVIFGDDETTSIATPKTTVTTNDRIYNLSGQEVKVLQRGGIYIKNGKKIIVK